MSAVIRKNIANLISGFESPFSPTIFFTVRGCENVHIYFWICKDLGWILNNKVLGMFFGTCALLWLVLLFYHALQNKNNEEVYFLIPAFLWLFANYLWMSGNLLYNSDCYRFVASCLEMVGLVMIVFYFSFLKKKYYFVPNEEQSKLYNDFGLICRFKSFNTWRRYEFAHMFFWLLKDYCWCSQDKLMWLAGAIPTLFVSIDFIIVTFQNKHMFVDVIHYSAQLIWIFSNLTWAFVELYTVGSDNPVSFSDGINHHPNGRFAASFILLLSLIPIVILYFIWLPLTYFKMIRNENEAIGSG
jgi:hypothetical protein